MYYISYEDFIIYVELCEDLLTNEKRKSIELYTYAMYRTNKVRIDKIINKYINNELEEILYKDKLIKNGDILTSEFDNNIENEYGDGIYYFNNFNTAYFHNFSPKKINYTGFVIEFYPNGNMKTTTHYENGLFHGPRTYYRKNKTIFYVINFEKDKIKNRLPASLFV